MSKNEFLKTSEHHRITAEMAQELGGRALHPTATLPPVTDADLDKLHRDFSDDPKNTLAKAREALLGIAHEPNHTAMEKQAKLSSYLDAYFDITVELDHQTYPSTPKGTVMKGVPDYIPDGFIDMGKESSTDPTVREREEILVDKREILEKYKPILMEVLGNEYEGLPLQVKKKRMATALARELYRTLPFNEEATDTFGGNQVRLSQISEGLCRHQSLVFQVLCQTIGLKSRILKTDLNSSRHTTNMVRFDREWYIFDVTYPDFEEDTHGNKLWKPGVFKADRPPKPGENMKLYNVAGRFSRVPRLYIADDEAYWRINTEHDTTT